jgi:hypothetical protein
MRSFFRSLERKGVRYLLISGQASILYGAATFSEDVDLWLEPSAANIERFVQALRRCSAVAHKLTPPLTVRNFRHGHGFHFRLPSHDGPMWYLDVMGKPPRVGSFSSAARRAVQFETPWGTIPVVALRDLVELKKTRRLADYDVISNLACIRLRTSAKVTRPLLQWALRNVFRPEDAQWIFETWPAARSLPVVRERTFSLTGIARDIASLQQKDLQYWSPIIDELRAMRRSGLLIAEGTPI